MKDLKRSVTVDLNELLPRWEEEVKEAYSEIKYDDKDKDRTVDKFAFVSSSIQIQLTVLVELKVITIEEYGKLRHYFDDVREEACHKMLNDAFKKDVIDCFGFNWSKGDYE